MTKANVSYARNHLSEILARVREGESILIVDRDQPVARLDPVAGPAACEAPWQTDLVRRGLIRPARRSLDPKALAAMPFPSSSGQGDVLDALLAEREDGR
jgi:prevent-host-death family protein